jgi:hypothetical protein
MVGEEQCGDAVMVEKMFKFETGLMCRGEEALSSAGKTRPPVGRDVTMDLEESKFPF